MSNSVRKRMELQLTDDRVQEIISDIGNRRTDGTLSMMATLDNTLRVSTVHLFSALRGFNMGQPYESLVVPAGNMLGLEVARYSTPEAAVRGHFALISEWNDRELSEIRENATWAEYLDWGERNKSKVLGGYEDEK